MSKADKNVALLVVSVVAGAVLLSQPPTTCNRGCRTLAEHLVSHGIDSLLGMFLP